MALRNCFAKALTASKDRRSKLTMMIQLVSWCFEPSQPQDYTRANHDDDNDDATEEEKPPFQELEHITCIQYWNKR